MQSSASSSLPINTNRRRTVFVWLVRIFLGGVFVFSGLAKAIDPWGGLYKMSDYFAAWGMAPSHEVLLILACGLASFEFMLGVLTLVGAYRRTIKWLVPAFMLGMTVLSLYIWLYDPVSDCGCFGDALVISNSATFFKNLVLLACAYYLWRNNGVVKSLYEPKIQWLMLIATFAYASLIQIIGYHVQPLIDFRPYPVGTDLATLVSEENSDDYNDVVFVYEKDGIKQDFNIDNLPDSTWTYVERKEYNSAGQHLSTFAVLDGTEDVTSEVILSEGEQYLLLVSDPQRYGISRSEMANRLYESVTENNDGNMIAIVALPSDSIDDWINETGAEYDVFSAEDTDLKMLARGDAALVYLNDGIIVWKRNVFSIPPEFPDGDVTVQTLTERQDNHYFLKLSLAWLITMFIILLISRYGNLLSQRLKRKTTQTT